MELWGVSLGALSKMLHLLISNLYPTEVHLYTVTRSDYMNAHIPCPHSEIKWDMMSQSYTITAYFMGFFFFCICI